MLLLADDDRFGKLPLAREASDRVGRQAEAARKLPDGEVVADIRPQRAGRGGWLWVPALLVRRAARLVPEQGGGQPEGGGGEIKGAGLVVRGQSGLVPAEESRVDAASRRVIGWKKGPEARDRGF